MLGEQFMVGEEICGAVVSIRFQVLHCYYSRSTSWRTVASSLTHLDYFLFVFLQFTADNIKLHCMMFMDEGG